MEKKLKALFDYQHFEKNECLEKLIGETERRYGQQLIDDELGMVNAAGEFTMPGGTIGANPAETDNWYGLENQNHAFEPGSRFWVNWLGDSNIPKETQAGGLPGYNTGGLTGSLIDSAGSLIDSGGGGGGGGTGGGSGAAM